MTRVVIEGTEASPITVRPADLPRNADHSYLKHIRLTGNWGARRSLRYVDLVASECDADLSHADITGIDSSDSEWAGVTLSEEQKGIFCCVWDIRMGVAIDKLDDQEWPSDKAKRDAAMAEVRKPENRGNLKPIEELELISSVTGTPVREIIRHHQNVYAAGSPFRKVIPVVGEVFVPRGVKLNIFRLDPDDKGYTSISEGQFTQPMRDAIQRRDRWELARAAEGIAPVPLIALCRRIYPRHRFDLVSIPRAWLADPERYGFSVPGNTPAQRLRSLLTIPNGIFGSRN